MKNSDIEKSSSSIRIVEAPPTPGRRKNIIKKVTPLTMSMNRIKKELKSKREGFKNLVESTKDLRSKLIGLHQDENDEEEDFKIKKRSHFSNKEAIKVFATDFGTEIVDNTNIGKIMSDIKDESDQRKKKYQSLFSAFKLNKPVNPAVQEQSLQGNSTTNNTTSNIPQAITQASIYSTKKNSKITSKNSSFNKFVNSQKSFDSLNEDNIDGSSISSEPNDDEQSQSEEKGKIIIPNSTRFHTKNSALSDIFINQNDTDYFERDTYSSVVHQNEIRRNFKMNSLTGLKVKYRKNLRKKLFNSDVFSYEETEEVPTNCNFCGCNLLTKYN